MPMMCTGRATSSTGAFLDFKNSGLIVRSSEGGSRGVFLVIHVGHGQGFTKLRVESRIECLGLHGIFIIQLNSVDFETARGRKASICRLDGLRK